MRTPQVLPSLPFYDGRQLVYARRGHLGKDFGLQDDQWTSDEDEFHTKSFDLTYEYFKKTDVSVKDEFEMNSSCLLRDVVGGFGRARPCQWLPFQTAHKYGHGRDFEDVFSKILKNCCDGGCSVDVDDASPLLESLICKQGRASRCIRDADFGVAAISGRIQAVASCS